MMVLRHCVDSSFSQFVFWSASDSNHVTAGTFLIIMIINYKKNVALRFSLVLLLYL